MSTLERPPRIPITEFSYDPRTRKYFRYGVEWKRSAVDLAVGPVEGLKASAWLRLQASGR